MLARLARERTHAIHLRPRTARGGHPRALAELALYQRSAIKSLGTMTMPDLLVVMIDANCRSYQEAKREIEDSLLPQFQGNTVVACPDPHVELWCMADLDTFFQVVGRRPAIARRKCERDYYKRLLANEIRNAGHPPTLGGIEIADDLVNAMDLFRAGKAHSTLKHFPETFEAQLTQREAR